MMTTAFARRTTGLAVCGLLAMTLLGGCVVTKAQLDERLVTYAQEQSLAETREKLQVSQDTLAAVQKEVEALKELRTKLQALSAKIDATTKTLESMASLPGRIAAAETLLGDHTGKLTAQAKADDDAKTDRAALRVAVADKAVKADVDKKFTSVDQAVAAIDKRVGPLEAKAKSLDESVGKLEKKTEAITLEITTLKKNAGRLDDNMTALSAATAKSMADQNSKISGLDGGLKTALSKEIDMLQARIKALNEVLITIGKNGANDTGGGGNGTAPAP